MNKKTILIAGIVLLLAALSFMLPGGPERPVTSVPAGPAKTERPEGRRAEVPAEHADLISKYSEARVNLAKHATRSALELLDTRLKSQQLTRQASLAGPGKPSKPKSIKIHLQSPLDGLRQRSGEVYERLQLSAVQEEQVSLLFYECDDLQLKAYAEKLEKIRGQEVELMKLMLASDACARKELGEEDYRALLAEADGDFRRMLASPNDDDFLGKDSAFLQQDFRQRFIGLLDPAQKEVFQAAPEGFHLTDYERQKEAPAGPAAMSLEARDKKLTEMTKFSATMLSAIREALGGDQ